MKKKNNTFDPRQVKQSGASRRLLGRRMIPWGLALAVVFLVVWGFLPKPLFVEVAETVRAPMTVYVFEEGKTRIKNRYMITAPVPAHLERVSLRPGDSIVAGETVLATLSPDRSVLLDPRTQAQAEARLRAAEASLGLRKTELERAKATLALSEKEYQRTKALYENRSIPEHEWDKVATAYQLRQREVRAAEFGLRIAEYDIEQARAALMQGSDAMKQGEPVEIVSPVSGYVLQVFEESARSVTPMMPIMEVGDPSDLEAEVELLSMDAVLVKSGAKVSIERWGGSQPLRGKVSVVEKGGYTKVSALGVEEQRVRVRVDFLDSFPKEEPVGDRYRIEARIATWEGENILQIPTGALFRRGTNWMVFTVEQGRAKLRKVEVGHQNGTVAEIRSGLEEHDIVILHPTESLLPDGEVRFEL